MQYTEFKRRLSNFTVFSLIEIRKACPGFYRRRLNEWQDKGYIKKIIKGFYIFSDLKLNERVLFEIANRIYSPSYISFEMALFYYGLIPESAYGITSVSTRRTYRFKTGIAEFSYRTLKPNLFFGYEIAEYDGRHFKIAAPEKALLDYFYINPRIKNYDDYASLRFNKARLLNLINSGRMAVFLNRFRQKVLSKRIKYFLEFMNHA